SASEHLEVNAKGYNGSFDFGKQLRLMYLFSAKMRLPVYYRLLGGNIVDVAAMALCVKEMGVSDVVYIADKGFYSTDNVAMLEAQNLKYIMPVSRNNPAINYGPIGDGEFKMKHRRFIWQGRVIWYYQYEASGHGFITYLDDRLRVEEEQDYLTRIATHPGGYTEGGYQERLRRFGTLTLTCRISGTMVPEEVYRAYKQRNEIEMMFDSYKTLMKADVSYMQNRYVLEGWLFTNFIAMIAYYKLYNALREAKLPGNYSPKDIIEMSKAVYKLRIQGTRHLAEVTAKVRKLLVKAGIDYLN
ncbi:MAG: transposase, partial [Treponema sp.]|nr:transposase [Treponema sp.]